MLDFKEPFAVDQTSGTVWGCCPHWYTSGYLTFQHGHANMYCAGPDEVTVYDPAVFAAIDGPGNKCTKPSWYDMLQPTVALNTTRDRVDHDDRRKVWNRALNPEGEL